MLLFGPPGTGKSHIVQALGYQAIKAGMTVFYRSIFDIVRDFLHDEAFAGHDKVMAKYLKPDLVIIDDMGMKQLPKRSGELCMRNSPSAVIAEIGDASGVCQGEREAREFTATGAKAGYLTARAREDALTRIR